MRYIAAAALHAKALQVLAVIEDAEERLANYARLFSLKKRTTSRNELELWPCGMPPFEPIIHQQSITEAAHRRLCAYYSKILSRLIDLQ